jgi:hypothetical protein
MQKWIGCTAETFVVDIHARVPLVALLGAVDEDGFFVHEFIRWMYVATL